jgi:hypothetical protein
MLRPDGVTTFAYPALPGRSQRQRAALLLDGTASGPIFDLSREAFSGGRLAFKAIAGPETALWITPAPEPGAFAAGCVALFAFATLRRARQ